MIQETLFLSLAQMRRRRPSRKAIVVSILDRSEAGGRPDLSGYRDYLLLEFEDAYEEVAGARAGDWPDEPTNGEHQTLTNSLFERVPALSDARRIVAFLRKHQTHDVPLRFIVHCYGGISRSAAVAIFASRMSGAPLGTGGMADTSGANLRLLRLLEKAHAE